MHDDGLNTHIILLLQQVITHEVSQENAWSMYWFDVLNISRIIGFCTLLTQSLWLVHTMLGQKTPIVCPFSLSHLAERSFLLSVAKRSPWEFYLIVLQITFETPPFHYLSISSNILWPNAQGTYKMTGECREIRWPWELHTQMKILQGFFNYTSHFLDPFIQEGCDDENS